MVQQASQISQNQPQGRAAPREFGQSWSLDGILKTLEHLCTSLERFGVHLRATPWTTPKPLIPLVVAMIVTTVLVRSLIVQVFGQGDGRWWMPPGLVILWIAILVGGLCQEHPELWKESRLRTFFGHWAR